MEGQKIKQDEIHIGQNIRRIRLEKGVGQTEFCLLYTSSQVMSRV